MSNKVVVQFDPDDHYFTVTDLILSTWGMKLTDTAHNLGSATRIVSKIEKGKLKPDIAIIESYMTKSEQDGKKIAEKLKKLLPEITIVGFSTFETNEWADHEAIKGLKDSNKIITDILSDIIGKEYKLSNGVETKWEDSEET